MNRRGSWSSNTERGLRAHVLPCRQGRDVRLRRPELEAERVDGRHEERHDRCRRRGRHDAGGRAAGALPLNVTGYLALTENMTGGRAMKLGDVLTMRNGKTVEVMNTDAEGRLILADALSYAVEQKPDRVLDLATLTGACMVALGPKVAGLFSNDDAFRGDSLAACRAAGERVWGLPLDDDYKEQLKSHVADLKNVGGKWGGAITAAKFLEQFVGSTPWVHLDIAGPSWSDSESATRDAGGTGCFVRTLVAYLEGTANDQQPTRPSASRSGIESERIRSGSAMCPSEIRSTAS